VPSGFLELDEMTGGLQRGEMIIIAARPSMGKTSLALNIAEQMAMRGHGVGFFSLEMGKQQVVQRLLAARSGLDLALMRRGLNSSQYQRLFAACSELRDAPMFIDDTPGLSLLQLRAKARRMAAKHAVKAVFIDYLQLLTSGGRVESRQMEVSEISRGIKAMARELNVPVICLSQLNRSPEQREGHKPRMSDLRESGSIEQDADVVAMLHREEYYHQAEPEWLDENPEKKGLAELIITKQRNGPTGMVKLSWIENSTRFKDYSPAKPPPGFERMMGGAGGSAYGAAPRGPGPSAGRVSAPFAAPQQQSNAPPALHEDDLDDLPV
jgi:replicative DNA helicase